MRRLLCVLFKLTTIATVTAQNRTTYDNYYIYPMDVRPLYSANFGEMRSNHFHSGIDLKTEGVEGKKLYAAADGYVWRVCVTPGGYGNAVYIKHPNGTTSVYAHMLSFADSVANYVKAERYASKRNAIDLYPKAGRFPVKQGEEIGRAGNSGSSYGPHLHYEIRDAAGKPINLMRRGLVPFTDDIPPYIMALHYIEVDSVGGVPIHSQPKTFGVKKGAGSSYTLNTTAPIKVGKRGYFVVEGTDRQNEVHNTFGIYRLTQRIDGETNFEYAMDGFGFDQTRYCNAVAYFPMQRGSKNEVIRMVQLAGNKYKYKSIKNRGLITTSQGERKDIVIEVEDDRGNISTLKFAVEGGANSFVGEVPEGSVKAEWNKSFSYADSLARVEIPANLLYESIYYTQKKDTRANASVKSDTTIILLSDVVLTGNYTTPLHSYMNLTMTGYVPENLRSRATIAYISPTGKASREGGQWKDGKITTRTRSFGRYCIVADLTPPEIKPLFDPSKKDMKGVRSISFSVKDNFSGIASFNATIDGKWVMLERHVVKNTVTLFFDDERFGTGRHTLRVTIADGVGNTSSWSGEFIR